MNNLALMVDIGNSTIVFGFFRDGKLAYRFELPTKKESLRKIDYALSDVVKKLDLNVKDFKGGLLISVVPSFTSHIKDSIYKALHFDIQVMDSSYFYDLKTVADNRNEIGQDLVADVYGCIEEYGTNCLIIDLGTITKIIPIDKDGLFVGVSFFPGVETSFKIMNENTALLCSSSLNEKPNKEYGNNTSDALTTGVYYANLGAIREFVKRAEKNFGPNIKKILTGGYAHLFASDLKEYIVDKDLVLKGIYQLYVRN